MEKLKGSSEEKIEQWVNILRQVALTAKELDLHPLMNLLICSVHKTIFYDEENVTYFLRELIFQNTNTKETIGSFVTLARFSYWYLKSASNEDTILSYGMDSKSPMCCKHVEGLNEDWFGKNPRMDFEREPFVLLLESTDRSLNGFYGLLPQEEGSMDCEHVYEKTTGSFMHRFSELSEGLPGCSGQDGCKFRLEGQVKQKKRKELESTWDPHNITTIFDGRWRNGFPYPEWSREEELTGRYPVPLKFFLNDCL